LKDEETERQRQSLEKKKKKAQGLDETPQDPSPRNP
jgi:hypothetical protein